MSFDYLLVFSGAAGEVWLADGAHFQEPGRTTPAGNGDPVGSLSGDQGNFNADQATEALRPTLRQDAGGKWYLEHIGDYLAAGTVADWIYLHDVASDFYVCMAISVGDSADPGVQYGLVSTIPLSGFSTGVVFTFEDAAANERLAMAAVVGGSFKIIITANGVFPPQTDLIIEFIKSGSTVTAHVNGTQVGTAEQVDGSSINHNAALTIGAYADGGRAMVGRVYGLLISDAVPSDQLRDHIQYDMDQRLVTPTGFEEPPPLAREFLVVPQGAWRVYRLRIEIPEIAFSEHVAPTNWQGLHAFGRANYLFASLHDISDTLRDSMTDALEADQLIQLYLESGYRTADGAEVYRDLFRSSLQTVDVREGPMSRTALLSGFLHDGLSAPPESLSLASGNTIRTGSVARGWIGPLNDNIFPGDQITLLDTGDTWVVGSVTYRVDGRSAVMDITELTDADLLATLPW